MIQANELRIGNWLAFRDVYTQVASISKNGIDGFPDEMYPHNIVWDSLDEYKPIPLTPEILEKAGFKIVEDASNWRSKKTHKIYSLDGNEDNFSVGVYNDFIGWWDKRIDDYFSEFWETKHLHQLQNLYFALTNKELDIEL
jgi:hypothetical protein